MQSPKYTVEPLQASDLHWFTHVAAKRMLEDELERPELFNPQHLYKLFGKMIADETGWIARVDGEPVGALGAVHVENLFNPEYSMLSELFWYVLPEYRKTRAGVMLFQEFDRMGDELGVERTLSLMPSSDINVQKMAKKGYLLKEYGLRKGAE